MDTARLIQMAVVRADLAACAVRDAPWGWLLAIGLTMGVALRAIRRRL